MDVVMPAGKHTNILTVYLSSDSPDCRVPQSDADACPAAVKFTASE